MIERTGAKNMSVLSQKVAVVTGGSKGIGKAIAAALLEEGTKVVIGARSENELQRCVDQLKSGANARVQGIVCDVREMTQVRRLIQSAVDEFGGLDILVNNAAVGVFGAIDEIAPEQWREVIDTNLTGVFHCCHAAVPHLKKRGGGYIINISSLAGKNAFPGGAAYNASKFGLNGFSEAIMQDLRYDNIRVSYVMPGSVNTRFGGHEELGKNSWKLAPEDVAHVVVDLLKHPDRCLASRVEMRPSRPPKK
ncbi:MAG: SDR family oxidoreductase [Acidobacteriota bacterium]